MPTITANPWKTRSGHAVWWVVSAALVLALMRIFGMLGPSQLRVSLPLGFVLMAVSPWLLLTREGRRQIGLVKPDKSSIYASAIGRIFSLLWQRL